MPASGLAFLVWCIAGPEPTRQVQPRWKPNSTQPPSPHMGLGDSAGGQIARRRPYRKGAPSSATLEIATAFGDACWSQPDEPTASSLLASYVHPSVRHVV